MAGLVDGPGATTHLLLTPPSSGLAMPWILSFGMVFPILTAVFITSVSLLVAYICVRAYSRELLLSLLFLACATTVFGLTTLVTAITVGPDGLETAGVVFTLGALVSSALHLACAVSTSVGEKPRLGRPAYLPILMSAVFLCTILIVGGALEGVLPQVYRAGQGLTLFGWAALWTAALVLATSSSLILRVASSTRSRVLLWYAVALAVTAVGVVGVALSGGDVKSLGMRLGWLALYAGGLFLFSSVLSAQRMTELAAPEGRGAGRGGSATRGGAPSE